MGRQRQHSHVPKFGNWDTADNVPYSAYFENARNAKAMVNPNDPEENPEVFNLRMRGIENNEGDVVKASPRIHSYSYSTSSLEKIRHEERGSNARRHLHHMSRGTHGSFTVTAESASERSNSDYSVIQRVKSDHKKSMSVGDSIIRCFSSSSHIKRRGGSHSFNDHANHDATLIPQFGDWDVTDPKSGEGYTAIFSKIKEEKQIASRRIPSKTPSLNNCSNIQNQCATPSSSILSKCCCCLFSSESK